MKVVNRSGYISEVEPGKGVILFDFYDEVCQLLKVNILHVLDSYVL